METINTLAPAQKTSFDFENNPVEVMSLDTLRRTRQENDIYGLPLKGLYHYQVIETVEDMCRRYNLNYQIEEIFAAQNRNKNLPGVTLLPQMEAQYGPKAIEAHVLRRVFTTIRIRDFDTDELTTTLAITYHQEGIQAAIGPCVLVCHNQCILSAERMVSDYGKNKVTTEQLFTVIDSWLSNFETQMNADRERIQRLKNTPISEQELYSYIGLLTTLRVAHDSQDKRLSTKVDTYPLNQGQISAFTEDVLIKLQEQGRLTAWDLYNVATELYKPGKTDFPSLLPQNLSFADTLNGFCETIGA